MSTFVRPLRRGILLALALVPVLALLPGCGVEVRPLSPGDIPERRSGLLF